jgi:hypothetical protein
VSWTLFAALSALLVPPAGPVAQKPPAKPGSAPPKKVTAPAKPAAAPPSAAKKTAPAEAEGESSEGEEAPDPADQKPAEPALNEGEKEDVKDDLDHAASRREWRTAPDDAEPDEAEGAAPGAKDPKGKAAPKKKEAPKDDPEKWTRAFDNKDFSLAVARQIAARAKDPALSADLIARALYILEVESPGEARGLAAKVGQRVREDDGEKVDTGPRILEQAKYFHSLYDVPCRGAVRRASPAWPPQYECSDQDRTKPSREPVPFIRLRAAPRVIEPLDGIEDKKKKPRMKDAALAGRRKSQIAKRDKEVLPNENLASRPKQFCHNDRCFKSYAGVAASLYGPRAATSKSAAPVFCAPRASGQDKEGKALWEKGRVFCSAQWLDTLGGWKPWTKEGEPAKPPREGTIPPFACFGSPHLFQAHMVLPAGGGGSTTGFHCRRRVFRVLASKAEQNETDRNRNIARVCAEMRQQVWGEKYATINQDYQRWCNGPKGPKDKSLCIPMNQKPLGAPGADALPFMLLSREEMLYFYGHQELYCRADRPGLTHFLYNDTWASTFTCAVPRGVLEAGPFEEGVQVCAVAPYAGREKTGAGRDEAKHLRARLHCWQFNRPTCEAVSKDPTKDDIHKSNVFDAFDSLREFRRTRRPGVWALLDLKEAEKTEDWEERIAYADSAKDEGTYGVREFCRFVGEKRSIQCGFNKKTMAQFYELRRGEAPAECNRGVCLRGAFRRGYMCGLFSTRELFEGRPHWMCGVDRGPAGQRLLRGATAVCLGGKAVERFQSSKGDKSSLQCYERRYLWGESAASERFLRTLDWAKLVGDVGKRRPRVDPWLYGGRQAVNWISKARLPKEIREILEGADAEVEKQTSKIDKEIKKAKRKRKGKKVRELRKEKRKKTREIKKEARKKIRGDKKLRRKLKMFRDKLRKRKRMLARGRKAATREFARQAKKDAAELKKWARKQGHTLGHRTSLRVALLGSNISIIRKFQALSFKAAQDFRFTALGDKCGGGGRCAQYSFQRDSDEDEKGGGSKKGKKKRKKRGRRGERKGKGGKGKREMAVNEEKAKELNEMLDEVRKEGRPADGRWYQSFRLAATEDGQMRVTPQELSTVRRVNRLFEVLEGARRKFLAQAKRYADAVYSKARSRRGRELLSRVEIHERARTSAIASRFKGSVYCVTDRKSRGSAGMRQFVCASSPLLVAGSVERKVGRRHVRAKEAREARRVAAGPRGRRRSARRAELEQRHRSKVRNRVSFDWCFGGMRGRRVFGHKPSIVLYQDGLSSPYALDVPKTVLKKPVVGNPLQRRSERDWIKCTGFQYSDESWEQADPPKREKAVAKKVKGPKTGDGRASEQTSKIMNKVGGLFGAMIRIVLPKFADAFERVKDLANAATEFIDKWIVPLVKGGQKKWQRTADELAKHEAAVKTAEQEAEKKREAFHKAEVDAAPPGPQKKQNDEKKARALEEWNEAKKEVKAKKNELKAAKKAAQKDRTIDGSGEVLGRMLEDLTMMVTKRISAIIEPNARQLLSRGFKFVRQILDPIAKSVISSLAGIPFVGAGLAALGQVAYSLALDALENLAFDGLFGIVERILAKGVRAVITPIFKAIQGKLLELAMNICSRISPEVCPRDGGLKFSALPPRDQWIERAMACQAPPIFNEELMRDAALARREILETAAQMRVEVADYARDLADRYLARHGLSYDAWMAAVGGGLAPAVVARAGRIDRALLKEAKKITAELEGASVESVR